MRQFLLTNMDRASPSSPYKFRLPLHFLRNAIDEIGHFPYAPGEKVFEKPSLFLKGASRALLSVFVEQCPLVCASADARCRRPDRRRQEQVHQLAQHPHHQAVLPRLAARDARCWSLGCVPPLSLSLSLAPSDDERELMRHPHAVHAERPKEFVELLQSFCKD